MRALFLSDSEVLRVQDQFRIPVDSFSPSKYWIIALDRESFLPTDEELRQIRSYGDYVIGKNYISPTKEKLLSVVLPAYSGHNTIIFNNGLCRGAETQDPRHWFFRRASWRNGAYYPNYFASFYRPHTLFQVMDKAEEFSADAWEQWKSQHPDIF